MSVNRRTVLKQFLSISAGVILLPSCIQENKSKASAILRNFSITADQEELLAELAETIIPKTNTPGAKDISAHLFTLKMMDDCRSKEDQDKFVKGLQAFEAQAKTVTGKPFLRATADERDTYLKGIDGRKDAENPAAFFYSSVKRYVIQAYSGSEYFLTKVQPYELVPGRYHGCVPVKAAI